MKDTKTDMNTNIHIEHVRERYRSYCCFIYSSSLNSIVEEKQLTRKLVVSVIQ